MAKQSKQAAKPAPINAMGAQHDPDTQPVVGQAPIRRADKGLWLRQHGGDFKQGLIKGSFSSCVGLGAGPIAIAEITVQGTRRAYIIDLREFVETVLAIEEAAIDNAKDPALLALHMAAKQKING